MTHEGLFWYVPKNVVSRCAVNIGFPHLQTHVYLQYNATSLEGKVQVELPKKQ